MFVADIMVIFYGVTLGIVYNQILHADARCEFGKTSHSYLLNSFSYLSSVLKVFLESITCNDYQGDSRWGKSLLDLSQRKAFLKRQRCFESAVAISGFSRRHQVSKLLDPFRWYKERDIKKRWERVLSSYTGALQDNAGLLRKSNSTVKYAK